jgi:hypothetical protein
MMAAAAARIGVSTFASVVSLSSSSSSEGATTRSLKRVSSRKNPTTIHYFPVTNANAGQTRAMKVFAASGESSSTFRYKKPRIDEGYNCVVTEKGAIISENIPSGTYEVSAWWGGTKKSKDDKEGEFLAPRCDTERQKGCEVKCEVVEEGCLVCEGLAEGTYRVTNVKDLNEECEVSFDGTSISCDEAEVEEFDVGDLEMKEKADDHSIRLGG